MHMYLSFEINRTSKENVNVLVPQPHMDKMKSLKNFPDKQNKTTRKFREL